MLIHYEGILVKTNVYMSFKNMIYGYVLFLYAPLKWNEMMVF